MRLMRAHSDGGSCGLALAITRATAVTRRRTGSRDAVGDPTGRLAGIPMVCGEATLVSTEPGPVPVSSGCAWYGAGMGIWLDASAWGRIRPVASCTGPVDGGRTEVTCGSGPPGGPA